MKFQSQIHKIEDLNEQVSHQQIFRSENKMLNSSIVSPKSTTQNSSQVKNISISIFLNINYPCLEFISINRFKLEKKA
jgi:hypothetical protein